MLVGEIGRRRLHGPEESGRQSDDLGLYNGMTDDQNGCWCGLGGQCVRRVLRQEENIGNLWKISIHALEKGKSLEYTGYHRYSLIN